MPITLDAVKSKGRLVADNDTYKVHDFDLNDLTVSVTELKVGKATRGHSHDSNAEVYFFPAGSDAEMTVGTDHFPVNQGAVLIPKGEFHRVENKSSDSELQFVAVFAGRRSESKAKYADSDSDVDRPSAGSAAKGT